MSKAVKRFTFEIDVKKPDEFSELIQKFKLSEEESDEFFDFGEYAKLELVVSRNMTFTGRFVRKP